MCGLFAQDGTPTSKTFDHVASEIGAEEAEEVGVEHLLRLVALLLQSLYEPRWECVCVCVCVFLCVCVCVCVVCVCVCYPV